MTQDLDSPTADSKGTFGTWDSIHVFEVATIAASALGEGPSPVKSAKYKLSSTVMLTLNRHEGMTGPLGNIDLSGSVSRQVSDSI